MPGQLCPQRVGRRPGHAFTQVGDADRDHLLEKRDPDKNSRCDHQILKDPASEGGIDEKPHDLRINHLQSDAGEQQER